MNVKVSERERVREREWFVCKDDIFVLRRLWYGFN